MHLHLNISDLSTCVYVITGVVRDSLPSSSSCRIEPSIWVSTWHRDTLPPRFSNRDLSKYYLVSLLNCSSRKIVFCLVVQYLRAFPNTIDCFHLITYVTVGCAGWHTYFWIAFIPFIVSGHIKIVTL